MLLLLIIKFVLVWFIWGVCLSFERYVVLIVLIKVKFFDLIFVFVILLGIGLCVCSVYILKFCL